ncbi:hypothetical protein C8R41DRAFT_176060 [Lentinula lateritia]|uniref:Uncharacterized protein n=1 Tax=Lentinula lateritia TaxID=40482 RepID=A0ABQ8VNJ8_9AGAR|nr:hypothetical protein C8R41DRAFT_176060 [Lentinula lateritia]
MIASFSTTVLVLAGNACAFIYKQVELPFTEGHFDSRCFTLSPGRPILRPFFRLLSRQRYQMNDIDTPSGLFFGICGLVNSVGSVHAAVGKVEIHKEIFSW